jgi:hypothetical protein
MPSAKLSALTDLAGAQVPADLIYIVQLSAGVNGSKKSSLNDFLSTITKNITDLTIRYQNSAAAAPAVSAANQGAMNYNATRQTFQGSRNTSAYEDLLFGSGSSTQIAFWGTLTDELLGSTSWTFNDSTKTVTLSNSNNLPNLLIQNTTVTAPNEIRGLLLGAVQFQAINFDATGNGATLVLAGGRTGPAFPLSGATLASILMGGVNAGGVLAAVTGGANILAIATENIAAGHGGTGLTIRTAANAESSTTVRFNINKTGCVQIGANGTGPSATLGGARNNIVLGNMTTYRTDAAIQCANPFTGNDDITFVIQANAGQTNAVFRVEQSTGQTLFFIGQAGSITIASTAVPAVSPANQCRMYYDTATQKLKLSENGGAYANVV